MKNKAWTMAELVVAITVIIIISAVSITIFNKPNTQKASIYMYATLKTLEKANMAIIEKYDEFYPTAAQTQDSDSTKDDWYCANLADMLTLKQKQVCTKEYSVTTPATLNLLLGNGVSIQGLTSNWTTPYTDADYVYKNIIIDIDGNDGINRIGYDRFPLRVYKDGAYDGMIRPVNCANDITYDDDGTSHALSTPYCKNNFTPSGSSVSNNFLQDNSVIAYDIYRPDSADESTTASIVVSGLAPMEADCMAYGGTGFYSAWQCAGAGYRIHYKCAKEDLCSSCVSTTGGGYNVCPNVNSSGGAVSTTAAACATLAGTTNTNDVPCFTLLHKPTAGLGFLAGGILGDIDF